MTFDALRSLGRSTEWTMVDSTAVRGDVGHPQGLCRWPPEQVGDPSGDGWLVSTVHPARAAGELVVVAGDGEVLRRVEVTDGERFHPGGFALDGSGCWMAVAEYRPRSTTTVMGFDDDLSLVESFPFDDHLGAICPLDDGTLFAVSWGSRRWYRLDTDGRMLDQRTTPTRWVDLQDIVRIDGRQVAATGVGDVDTPDGAVQLGGLVVIDVDAMAIVHDTPIAAWMPSGRTVTYNGAHLDTEGDGSSAGVRLHCLVDDITASIATWDTTPR